MDNKHQIKHLINQLGYKNQSVTYKQLKTVVQQYKTLKVEATTHVFNSGHKQNLVRLTGVVGIVYQNASYNTPIRITVPINFPEAPPICYVRAQSGMIIQKKHPNVDMQGAIYHPCLLEWTQSYQMKRNPTLIGLIMVLRGVFSARPPLFASPKKANSTVQAQSSRSNLVQNQGPSDRQKVEKIVRAELQTIYDSENAKIKQFNAHQVTYYQVPCTHSIF